MKQLKVQNAIDPEFIRDDILETDLQFIAADHPEFYYIGRIDTLNPRAPVFIWQGTEVRAKFSGRYIGFRFSKAFGENFFNVIIDGKIRLFHLREGEYHDYLLNEALPAGKHELILFKRNEALFSNAVFHGIILEKDAQFGPRPRPLPIQIEFYGDSITAGACNENPDGDNYDDYSTHNNYLAFGAITARNINAEYSCIAVSGTGVCYSWNPVLMLEIYDRLYPDRGSRRYDFAGRKPDIVVLNLGQNDYGYPISIEKRFPIDFTEKYTELVRNIRGLYPKAYIICAIGGMSAYHESSELQDAFKKAVDQLQDVDSKVLSFIFSVYSANHPRVDTHAKLAEELTDFIKNRIMGNF
jgi:lysophospholipase L1-like esterase